MMNKESSTFTQISQVAGSQNNELPAPVITEDAPGLGRHAQANNSDTSDADNYEHMKKAVRTMRVWMIIWTIFNTIQPKKHQIKRFIFA